MTLPQAEDAMLELFCQRAGIEDGMDINLLRSLCRSRPQHLDPLHFQLERPGLFVAQ